MTDPLNVPAEERETVRVFALDLPHEEAQDLLRDAPANGAGGTLAQMLGVDALDRDHVEVFPASDLKGVGLSGYVAEGLGVDESDVAPDANTLDETTGHVVIVHSGAFGGKPAQIAPRPPLRHLGTYRMAQAAPPMLTTPVPPGDETSAPAPTASAGPPARMPRSLGLLALLGAAVLILLVAYLIGGGGR